MEISTVIGMPATEIMVRARYAETDAMGIVHHASYIIWLEQARTELLRTRGASYRLIEEQGFFVVLTDLQARYLASARYDDLVAIRVRMVALRSRQIIFAYELHLAETGTVLLTARSEHVVVARDSGRPARLPPTLLQRLADSIL